MKPPTSLVLKFLALVFLVVLLLVSVPLDQALADANPPTETPTPTITNTPQPTNTSPPTGPGATDTPVPIFPSATSDIALPEVQPTVVPPAQPDRGGLSTIDRILLVLLAIAVVIVIGVIVYLVYYQTRGDGSY